MNTELIYLTDAYAVTFEARVVAVDEEAQTVILDRTAFYPGGGGQPSDFGSSVDLKSGLSYGVSSVKKQAGDVLHFVDGNDPLPNVGSQLTGSIEWDRRYRLMRTHTALHVLCGVVYRDFGALVTGGNMDVDKARMDFELEDLFHDRVNAIERATNEEIAAAREIRVQILPRDEAFQIPDLIRTKINLLPEGITEVRTVEIVGLDLQADGGAHVANTREVGGIQVTGTRSKGRINKRLEIVLVDGTAG